MDSVVVYSGVGDCKPLSKAGRAGLCGSGDISMLSRAGAGEDEGTGGVVDGTAIRVSMRVGKQGGLDEPLPVVNMLPLNSDRLGVGYCGLLLSS